MNSPDICVKQVILSELKTAGDGKTSPRRRIFEVYSLEGELLGWRDPHPDEAAEITVLCEQYRRYQESIKYWKEMAETNQEVVGLLEKNAKEAEAERDKARADIALMIREGVVDGPKDSEKITELEQTIKPLSGQNSQLQERLDHVRQDRDRALKALDSDEETNNLRSMVKLLEEQNRSLQEELAGVKMFWSVDMEKVRELESVLDQFIAKNKDTVK